MARAKNFDNALKVSAYAPTAAWLAGVFRSIPVLGILSILGLYSLYLLYTGCRADAAAGGQVRSVYTIAVIVCVVIVWAVIFAIPAALFGVRHDDVAALTAAP